MTLCSFIRYHVLNIRKKKLSKTDPQQMEQTGGGPVFKMNTTIGTTMDTSKQNTEVTANTKSVASAITSDEDAMENIFNFFDGKGGGSVSSEDLARMSNALDMRPNIKELDEIIGQFDTEGKKTLEPQEFKNMADDMLTTLTQMHEVDLKSILAVFDPDEQGFIRMQSLEKVLTTFLQDHDENAVTEMLEEVFANGNDRIGYNEFIRLIFQDQN